MVFMEPPVQKNVRFPGLGGNGLRGRGSRKLPRHSQRDQPGGSPALPLGWKGFDYEEIKQKKNELGQNGCETISTIAASFGAGQAIEVAIILQRAPEQRAL